MGAFQDIRSILETKLAGMPSCPPIAWEGVAFTPTPGEVFFRAHLLPSGTDPHEIGLEGNYKHSGIFQVSICAPDSRGTVAALRWADVLSEHFHHYKAVSATTSLAVSVISIGPCLPEDGWIYLPVSIRYYAFSTF